MNKTKENSSNDEIRSKVISYLVSHEEFLVQFVNSSGISPIELTACLQSDETMGYLLDFLLQDERALVNFCTENMILPENVWKVRYCLPGAPIPWN